MNERNATKCKTYAEQKAKQIQICLIFPEIICEYTERNYNKNPLLFVYF